jgi:predicted dehydrogenase
MKRITPFLLGKGSAGMAMTKALAIAQLGDPELGIDEGRALRRGQSLADVAAAEHPLLLVANPHGLHAQVLVEAARVGLRHVIVEKPACVTLEEAALLADLGMTVAVGHGYRTMWGPGALKQFLDDGFLGELVAIEGRYWQSSAATKALQTASSAKPSWKNDPTLNGPHDALVDLGAHWVDLALYLVGKDPREVRAWRSYANAEAPHRDTHVHFEMQWETARSIASISKTWHGAGNQLEVHVLGTSGRASWDFQNPDRVELARGGETTWIPRPGADRAASHQAPFHGLGWLEGYVAIARAMAAEIQGREHAPFPTLAENLRVMRTILRAT